MALSLERSDPKAGFLNQGIAIVRGWPWRLLATLGSVAVLLGLAIGVYQASARPATLTVDGTTFTLRTHQRLVGGVLREAGISLGPGDQVTPALDAPWQPDRAIVVERSFPVTVRADGRTVQFYGRPRSLLEVLSRAGVALHPADDVYANGTMVSESAYSDEMALRWLLGQHIGAWHLAAPTQPASALRVEIVRAVPIFAQDDGLEMELRTTAATVGQALEEAGLRLYRADRVYPPLDTPVNPGLHLFISRALPVRITVDGQSYGTRTWAGTVAELLQEEGLTLDEQDYVAPPVQTLLRPDMAIRVVRVTAIEVGEQSTIPYEKRQEPDPELELDQYRLRPGQEGLLQTVTRITYEDGQEVKREFLGEEVTREPVDEVFYYGTRVVVRTLETADGTIEYWRKLRVLATSYYPGTCDKSPGDPGYGITYTGRRATRGVIAVDPRYIRLHTRMYVPGYGFGAAEDIGGRIRGRHIDVCFDDADRGRGLWDTHYVDVYLLTPVPPPGRIPYIIP
jgi:uncharacterized protein YabE (DUF348 family)